MIVGVERSWSSTDTGPEETRKGFEFFLFILSGGHVGNLRQEQLGNTCRWTATFKDRRLEPSNLPIAKQSVDQLHLVSCLVEQKSVFPFQLNVLSLQMCPFVHSNSPTSA